MDLSKYEERERPQHKKKNTRKWCKGKKGREHDPVLIKRNDWLSYQHKGICHTVKRFISWNKGDRVYEDRWYCCHILKCSKCGKIIKDFPDECPDNEHNLKMYWSFR